MSVLVVILSSLGTLLGAVLAASQILRAMRRKWDQDREQTKAVRDNTAALKDMTAQFAALNTRVDDHERRLVKGSL